MLSSELQPANALSPIDVTLSGTVICLNPQLWNAALSIAVSTLSSPKFTSRREVQPLNAPVPKEASLLPSPKSAAVKAVQPLNALPSIAVSSFENFTFASEEQPLNALPPILAEFKFTAVIEVQPLNAFSAIGAEPVTVTVFNAAGTAVRFCV